MQRATAFFATSALITGGAFAAPTFTVNSVADDPASGNLADGVCQTSGGECTLRAAIMEANHYPGGGATIIVPAGRYLLYNGPSTTGAEDVGDLDLNAAMTIQGAGADVTLIDAATVYSRVVHNTATVELRDLALLNGRRVGETGGIFNEGTLTLRRVRVAGNQALFISGLDVYNGGAVYNTGTLHVIQSSIDHNRGNFGGAILNYNTGASVTLDNSTLSDNVGSYSGAIENYKGAVSIAFSTITGNVCSVCGSCANGTTTINSNGPYIPVKASVINGNFGCAPEDLAGQFYSYGRNIRGNGGTWIESFTDLFDDPLLQSPAANGGTTPTRAPLAGSVAIDTVPNGECSDLADVAVTEDQRGVARPAGSACDIGAYEGSVPSGLLGRNLLRNGDSEGGGGAFYETVPVPYWSAAGGPLPTVIPYCVPFVGTNECSGLAPTFDTAGPADRGSTFFAGSVFDALAEQQVDVVDAYAAQTFDLTPIASQIAAGQVGFELSGYLGGYASEADYAEVVAEVRNVSAALVQTVQIGPVSAAERGNVTALLRRRATAVIVPTGRSVKVTMHFHSASGVNTGYADNVSLVLSSPPDQLFADDFEVNPGP